MEPSEKKRLRRNDVIFIAILVAVIAIVAGCLYLFGTEGDTVIVSVDGKEIATYPLAVDRVEDILTGEDGVNRLVIKDGKAYMETASCPDGICVDHRPIHRAGESIICLPNKVVVTVKTVGTATDPDVVI